MEIGGASPNVTPPQVRPNENLARPVPQTPPQPAQSQPANEPQSRIDERPSAQPGQFQNNQQNISTEQQNAARAAESERRRDDSPNVQLQNQIDNIVGNRDDFESQINEIV